RPHLERRGAGRHLYRQAAACDGPLYLCGLYHGAVAMCVMALGLIGGVIGAVGSLVGAQQQAQAANNQAAIYARQAAAERAQAEFNANQTRSKAIKVISQQRTGYLASGLSLEGSPTD